MSTSQFIQAYRHKYFSPPKNDGYLQSLKQELIKSIKAKDITLGQLYTISDLIETCIHFEYTEKRTDNITYFSHCLRVARLSLIFSSDSNRNNPFEDIVLSLVHNIIEVTNMSESSICELVGVNLFNKISTLTIDRESSSSHEYLNLYYSQIAKNDCLFIKSCDKLDNLLQLIYFNDSHVKELYVFEIENFLMPLISEQFPTIYDLMNNLCLEIKATL